MNDEYANTIENFNDWAPRLYRDFLNLLIVQDISPIGASYFYAYFLAMNLDSGADEEDIRDFLRVIYESLVQELKAKKEEEEEMRK